MDLDSLTAFSIGWSTEKFQYIFNCPILFNSHPAILIQFLIKFDTNNLKHPMFLIFMTLPNIKIRSTSNLKFHQRQQEYVISYFFDDSVALNEAIAKISSDKLLHWSYLPSFLPENDRRLIKSFEELFQQLFSFVTSHMMNILFRGQVIRINSL